MRIPDVIRKAIEGGWRKDWYIPVDKPHRLKVEDLIRITKDDPEFWSSLGKTAGEEVLKTLTHHN